VITIEQAKKVFPANDCPSDEELQDMLDAMYACFDVMLEERLKEKRTALVHNKK